MPRNWLLSKKQFLANLAHLRQAKLAAADGVAGDRYTFYDQQLLNWLTEQAQTAQWRPFGAFQEVVRQVLQGPLEMASMAGWSEGSGLPAEVAAAQLGHRFHGLMAAFSPSICFDDPGKEVRGAAELIRSSEGDYLRCKPFIESIQSVIGRQQAEGRPQIDMLDGGCGPHLFWSVLALCMSPQVRVCALERDPALAAQAQAFASALGVQERVRVLQLEATEPSIGAAISAAFGAASGTGTQAFSPALIVSETHCALMFEEAGDQIGRNLQALFPRATLVPEGVEIVGGCIDRRHLQRVLASTGAYSFARLRGIAQAVAQFGATKSLGRYLALDVLAQNDGAAGGLSPLDAHGRRLVGPLLVAASPMDPSATTPVLATRLLFPPGVAPLEPGHSLGITEWLWAVRPVDTPLSADPGHCQLRSIFMQPGAAALELQAQQQLALSFTMGAGGKPIVASLTSALTSTAISNSATHSTSTNQWPTMQNTETTAANPLEITTSRQFLSWLGEQKLSIALTTYQIGKLFLLGLKPNGELSIFERTFNRCMGLCPTGNGFYMSSLHQVWRFENVFTQGELQDGYDRLYVPQVGNTTGDLDIHDMAVDADGRLVFVNTLFGCLATLSETHSFKPLWRPPFISKLAAEDRCHLNGLAMKDGRAAYVTAVGQSDVVDGWRDHRANGGIVIDVNSNEIVAGGLSMPHSPRWHQGKLWVLNSGTGEFGHIELETGRFVPVTFCAGYMRGLYFHGDYALIGTSKPRHNKTFSGLALDENLKTRGAEARCGVQVIDLRTGDAVHWLRIEGVVDELYDVITLPGVRSPMALGFKTDEIRRVLSIEE